MRFFSIAKPLLHYRLIVFINVFWCSRAWIWICTYNLSRHELRAWLTLGLIASSWKRHNNNNNSLHTGMIRSDWQQRGTLSQDFVVTHSSRCCRLCTLPVAPVMTHPINVIIQQWKYPSHHWPSERHGQSAASRLYISDCYIHCHIATSFRQVAWEQSKRRMFITFTHPQFCSASYRKWVPLLRWYAPFKWLT